MFTNNYLVYSSTTSFACNSGMAAWSLFVMDVSALASRSHSQSRSLASLSCQWRQRNGRPQIRGSAASHHLDQDFLGRFPPHRRCLNSIPGKKKIPAMKQYSFSLLHPCVTIISGKLNLKWMIICKVFPFPIAKGTWLLLKSIESLQTGSPKKDVWDK